MPKEQDSFEISGDFVVHKINGIVSKKIPVSKFAKAIQHAGDQPFFPGILPEGVKYGVRRDELTVMVVEQAAMPRNVFVIADDSPVPFGSGVKSERRWLSFPFVIMLILFNGENISGNQQIFYRNAPLKTVKDKLYLCNLPNVSTMGPGGLPHWFCSQYIHGITPLAWPDKIRRVVDHLWKTGFNWSSDYHEGLSQFKAMQNLDKRLSSFALWEKATRKDPYFALQVKWKAFDLNLSQAIEKLLEFGGPRKALADSFGLADLDF
jgi:hypothetical protein